MKIKLGKALFEIRQEKRLSQQEVAVIINSSRGSYSCWERDEGEIPFSKLMTFLTYCKIPLSAFLARMDLTDVAKGVQGDVTEKHAISVNEELLFISERIDLLRQHLN